MNNTDNTDGRKVDWDKPIEAVHTDGHIAAVEPTAVPVAPGMAYGGKIEGRPWGFDLFGLSVRATCPWRIRNVTQPATIDWNGKLEAVHEDGRVVAVTAPAGVYGSGYVDITPELPDGAFSFMIDGTHRKGMWTIRNVTTPQQAEPIKWGEPIKVDGKKPDWLDDDCYVDIQSLDSDRWYSEGASGLGVGHHHIGRYRARFIRLPHDHPHYADQQAVNAVPQEIVERMVALIRLEATGQWSSGMVTEARAIVAMLEPVDEMLMVCREICALDAFERYKADNLGAELAGYYRIGDYDDGKEMTIALAAYRRALAKEAGE